MKHFYIAFSAQLDGKNYAGTLTKTSSDNIALLSQQIPRLTAANLCATRREAEELADTWNAAFKANGTSVYTD